jgi:hypothetical protein
MPLLRFDFDAIALGMMRLAELHMNFGDTIVRTST